MSVLYIAKSTGAVILSGVRHVIVAGKTIAEEGHELVKKHPELWKQIEPRYKAPKSDKPSKPKDK